MTWRRNQELSTRNAVETSQQRSRRLQESKLKVRSLSDSLLISRSERSCMMYKCVASAVESPRNNVVARQPPRVTVHFYMYENLRCLSWRKTPPFRQERALFMKSNCNILFLQTLYIRLGKYNLVPTEMAKEYFFWDRFLNLAVGLWANQTNSSNYLLGKCKALLGKPRTLSLGGQRSAFCERLSQRSTELSCRRFDAEGSRKSKAIYGANQQDWPLWLRAAKTV